MKIIRTLACGVALGGLALTVAPASAESVGMVGGAWSSRAAPGASSGARTGGIEMNGGGRWDGHEKRRGRPGRFRDFGLLGYGEPSYRHNRTALSRGYFGHGGTDGRGRYDYDRGYPYDYYSPTYAEDALDHVEHERPHRGVPRCDVERVRDDDAGEEVAVRICRN